MQCVFFDCMDKQEMSPSEPSTCLTVIRSHFGDIQWLFSLVTRVECEAVAISGVVEHSKVPNEENII